jgi:hypothetical protein
MNTRPRSCIHKMSVVEVSIDTMSVVKVLIEDNGRCT